MCCNVLQCRLLFFTTNLARTENVEKTENVSSVACLEFGGTQCKGRASVPTNVHSNVIISEMTRYTKVTTDVFKRIWDFGAGE